MALNQSGISTDSWGEKKGYFSIFCKAYVFNKYIQGWKKRKIWLPCNAIEHVHTVYVIQCVYFALAKTTENTFHPSILSVRDGADFKNKLMDVMVYF